MKILFTIVASAIMFSMNTSCRKTETVTVTVHDTDTVFIRQIRKDNFMGSYTRYPNGGGVWLIDSVLASVTYYSNDSTLINFSSDKIYDTLFFSIVHSQFRIPPLYHGLLSLSSCNFIGPDSLDVNGYVNTGGGQSSYDFIYQGKKS